MPTRCDARLAARVTAVVLAVLLCAACVGGSDNHKPDDESLPGWVRTYVELADKGVAQPLADHLSQDSTARAMASIESLGAGQGWTVVHLDSKPTGVSADERDVLVRVRNSGGQEKNLKLALFWQDGKWKGTEAGVLREAPASAAQAPPLTSP